MTTANGQQEKAVLEDVYYALKIHVWLLSLRKLEGQGWDIRFCQGMMELRDWHRDVFAYVPKANNIYPVGLVTIPPGSGLVAWREDDTPDLTEAALVNHLEHVGMSATARGGNRREATLLTWHHWLGHCSFKSVVNLVCSRVSNIIVTDLPAVTPSLDARTACVAVKLVHLPHKTGRNAQHSSSSAYMLI